VVLEIDPAIKRALHARLAAEGRTLKDWFLEQTNDFLNPRQQALPLYAARAEAPVLMVAENTSTNRYSRRSK
jgi:hypothetical protein